MKKKHRERESSLNNKAVLDKAQGNTRYRKTYKWIAALSVALITFLVYLPALKNGFVNWDDNLYVYENPNIRSLDFNFLKWSFTDTSVGHWHPLTWLSLSLDYTLWGLNPWGFHLANIILHSVNTLLVFILAMRLIGDEGRRSNPVVPAFITALLFGIHPVHVESVAWVTERKDVLSLLFFLLTILYYIKYNESKKRLYYGATLLLFTIALMAKPMAVTLPIVLLILDFYPLRRFEKGKDTIWVLIEKIPFFLLSLISSLITIRAAGSAGAIGTEFSLITRLFISARGYIFYLIKMLFPFNLAPLYPYPKTVDILAFGYLGSAVFLLFITIYCLWSLKRGRLLFSVWIFYVVTLLPVIGIVHAGPQDTADRYTYMPSLSIFLLIGFAVGNIFERYSKRIVPIAILFLLSSGFLIVKTVKQINIWGDPITFWSQAIKLYPKTASVAFFGRGDAYSGLGKDQTALIDLNRAIEINPKYASAYNNRGFIYYNLGNYKDALQDLNKAIELNPKSVQAYNNRGFIRYSLGNYKDALVDLNMAIKLNPRFKDAYGNLGNLYAALGDFQQAINSYNEAMRLDQRDAKIYFKRGNAYAELGLHEYAIADYSRVVELNPGYAKAYKHRGKIFGATGDYKKAKSDFERAIEIDPQDSEAYYYIGMAYSYLGSPTDARKFYQKAADMGLKQAQEVLAKDN